MTIIDEILQTDLALQDGEEFRAVVGYEGLYEVSNKGRIKRLPRIVMGKSGCIRTYHAKIMKIQTNYGRTTTRLSRNNKQTTYLIHKLVWNAFGNMQQESDHWIFHKNKDRTDNNIENLELDLVRMAKGRDNNKAKFSSQYTGVSYYRSGNKHWRCSVWYQGTNHYLGSYDTEIEAYLVYRDSLQNLKMGVTPVKIKRRHKNGS